MSELHPRLAEIIDRIEGRSRATRVAYLDQIDEMHSDGDSDGGMCPVPIWPMLRRLPGKIRPIFCTVGYIETQYCYCYSL